jgi:hypothetical protein
VLLGYGLAAVTKPLFPLAGGVGLVLSARFIDRIGKGIRGAPRDALIADATPIAQRGAAFGLRQSMDTIGAFLGPTLAMLFMALSDDNFRLVFWVAVIPAIAAVFFVVYGVDEPVIPRAGERLCYAVRVGSEMRAIRSRISGSGFNRCKPPRWRSTSRRSHHSICVASDAVPPVANSTC